MDIFYSFMYDIRTYFPCVLQITPLYRACESGHLAAVNVLLETGANVTAVNVRTKFNCLEIAVENGHKYVIYSTAMYNFVLYCHYVRVELESSGYPYLLTLFIGSWFYIA